MLPGSCTMIRAFWHTRSTVSVLQSTGAVFPNILGADQFSDTTDLQCSRLERG